MDSESGNSGNKSKKPVSRRQLLKGAGLAGVAAVALTPAVKAVKDAGTQKYSDALGEFFQKHYKKMTKEEMAEAISRLERKANRSHGVDIKIKNSPPLEGVLFGYALNISKCKGYRDCVHACVKENNLNRDTEIQYIRVLELDNDSMDFEKSEHYYDGEQVPVEGKNYLPVQCHQCDDSPCERACPVKATWKEPDGIVVVDYNWCIGCRYCIASCPYWARRFNWNDNNIPEKEVNRNTHYLGNRPRMKGVVEKCTFCINRTRDGKQPACQEACPTGARVFGNLLDPDSELRYILENKTVFRLKEELNTNPKFWYYAD
ncbi:MAG: 4Fe-4S dicluster domain-containing protein [Proteobacteria bacterium]|nr:4Fe-4S dicluster domain-containing protein [Pseudomonadota bacterium]